MLHIDTEKSSTNNDGRKKHCKFREGASRNKYYERHFAAVSFCCSLDEGANWLVIRKFVVPFIQPSSLWCGSCNIALITGNHEQQVLELIKWFSDRYILFDSATLSNVRTRRKFITQILWCASSCCPFHFGKGKWSLKNFSVRRNKKSAENKIFQLWTGGKKGKKQPVQI